MKNQIREEKGITLIALVITIILLLILAGVSITFLTGENGLISKALLAKEKTQEARIKEEKDLADIEKYVTNRDGSITIDSDTLNQMIENKVNEKMYTPTIFTGTVVTNTMGASDTAVKTNEFTVTENGKYIINYISSLNWNTSSVFIVLIDLNGTKIGGNTYSNKDPIHYNNGFLNATVIKDLKVGDKVSITIYQYGNGLAGANNLATNELQLIKLGN